MSSSKKEILQRFHDAYRPDWKLHQFTSIVWELEFEFDQNGPTKEEFEAVYNLVGDYFDQSRKEFANRLEGCSGFATGRPFTAIETKVLKEAGVRILLTKISVGEYLIYMGEMGRYWFVGDAMLRAELAAWKKENGVEVEVISVVS